MGNWKKFKKKAKEYGKQVHVGLSEEEKQELGERRMASKERKLESQMMRTKIEEERSKQRKHRQMHRPAPSQQRKPGLGFGGSNDFFSVGSSPSREKVASNYFAGSGMSYFGKPKRTAKRRKRKTKKGKSITISY